MSSAEIAQTDNATYTTATASQLASYLLTGLFFGVLLVKSEAASWFRIQEMFRFQNIHMFGLLGSAIATGMLSTALLRRYGHTRTGEAINITPKAASWPRYIIGGLLFGLGWGMVGACPGPIFVLMGSGEGAIVVVFIFALLGTYLYGALKDRLPH